VLGEEKMIRFLAEYAVVNQNRIVSEEDFFLSLGEYIDVKSLEWLGEFFD